MLAINPIDSGTFKFIDMQYDRSEQIRSGERRQEAFQAAIDAPKKPIDPFNGAGKITPRQEVLNAAVGRSRSVVPQASKAIQKEILPDSPPSSEMKRSVRSLGRVARRIYEIRSVWTPPHESSVLDAYRDVYDKGRRKRMYRGAEKLHQPHMFPLDIRA